jgi:ketosteroid isomerase-like protein
MPTTQETVSAFYANLQTEDYAALRTLLHDDLHFHGPVDRFTRADHLISKLTKLGTLTEGFRIRHLFVDDDRACCVYDLVTSTPLRESPVTEYFELRDGRISAIHAFYDSRPWVALFAREAS